MKTIFFAFSLFMLIRTSSEDKIKLVNTDFELEKIRDFRIKIDGGCGIYNDAENHLGENNSIFVINAAKKGSLPLEEIRTISM